MRKIITLIVAMLFMCNFATAQTVEHSKFFQNMYIGIDGGVVTPMIPAEDASFFDVWNPTFGIEVGKNVTPITGFSIEGQGVADITNGIKNTKITESDVFGNVKFNLMNLFGGYKGYPRMVELSTVAGIGWVHDFNEQPVDPNYIAYKTGLQLDFNLGKNRAWQINMKPSVIWNHSNQYTEIQYLKNGAEVRGTVGVTYKFGYRNMQGVKTHNFTMCPYSVTADEYNSLMDKYNELLDNCKDTVVVEKEVTVEKVVETVVNVPTDLFIDFKIGSSVLSTNAENMISSYAENIPSGYTVKVIGSADTKTGNEGLNKRLADERANAVINVLEKCGVKDVVKETTLDIDENAEASRCALIMVRK